MEGARDLVRQMWTAYREGGVEAALPLLDPGVEFVAADGTSYRGHDGIRSFFQAFEDQGRSFEASPYSFEGQGDAVLVVGHRRIHSDRGTSGAYMFFLHVIRDGAIVKLSAHWTRDEAQAALRGERRRGTRS